MPSHYCRPALEQLLARADSFWARLKPNGECLEYDGPRNTGDHQHGLFLFALDKVKYRQSAHRAAYMLHHRVDLTPEQVVRHRCDNPACANPAHLDIGTHADNVADRVLRGRSATHERHGRAKLTMEKAREIRASSEPIAVLAKRYSVDRKLIRQIRLHEIWKERD